MNRLKNRAECINKVHTYLNETAKEIQEELAKGFRINNDFRLYKKDKERIDAIIDKRPHFRAILKTNEYSIALWVDDNYQNTPNYPSGGYGCCYYGKTVYLWDNNSNKPYELKALPLTSCKELENAEIELREVEDKISSLRSRKYELEAILK